MIVQMTDSCMENNVAHLENFLKGSEKISFKVAGRKETYRWVEQILVKFSYALEKKKNKKIIKAYIKKMTGYSRAQVTRLITQYISTGKVKLSAKAKHTFENIYQRADIVLLAHTDELHDYPNGAALKKILERMVKVYKMTEYQNISNISVAQIYNFRHSVLYERLTKKYTATKPNVVNIGERRKPDPQGKPGYLRVDTVHQGDEKEVANGKYQKGVYHINMVDEVTQSEFVGAAEKISELYLLPLLETLINNFPFVIIEFHADNGGEYINHIVAGMLNKLLIKLTKSRSRKSNDNALVEGKNGSVIRKWIGYCFIEQRYASEMNKFYSLFNEYLNFHRPCAFAREIVDRKGKVKKIYKPSDYMTPYEKLKSLENAEKYLKPEISFESLEKQALRYTDNEMARLVQEERRRLFDKILPVNKA